MDSSKGLTQQQALDLAIKMVQADALANLAHAFRRDGEFQESMYLLSKK